jgi:polar amino acid transport system substrate-binding protein
VVALINGWVIFERNLSPTQAKTAVTEPDQMFAMLAKNRVDIVLYERWQGLYRARLSGLDVRVHEPPLASVDMYMYVHQDYAHLAPKLAQALRDMKADGTYQAIFDLTLTPLTQKTDGN